jgi:hypothetical protein
MQKLSAFGLAGVGLKGLHIFPQVDISSGQTFPTIALCAGMKQMEAFLYSRSFKQR